MKDFKSKEWKDENGLTVRRIGRSNKFFILYAKDGREVTLPQGANMPYYFAKGYTMDKPEDRQEKTEQDRQKLKAELREELLSEMKSEEKPKRTRRTKAQMEADKAKE